ncbi:hypothetical protein UFOVP112_349 [uncultured Caudovirales phage]|uniref:Uncharacterized protein n=1 Tax=uncultured Caudovirales phage TaxID=2100421 RepID=A0A6J5L4M0_9CAUD|nr:hypothetical protein UFOVP112_349 [uncultured Caudovirales phage]
MRAREYLLEYNRQKTEQNYGDKIVMIARRDPTIPGEVRKQADNLQLIDIVLSQLERADPTKNKEYVQGLAKLYANGGLKMEDASSTLADYLTKFHKLKVKRMVPPPYNDFLRYTKVTDMMDVVDQLPDPDADKKEVDKGRVIEYYNDAEIRIVLPQDEAAACYYGQGTRWCTAAKNHNMFDSYADQGTIYIVIPKHPEHSGEKYQLHFESGQYMDEGDNPVTMRQLLERFPTLKTALEEEGRAHGVLSLMSDADKAKVAAKGKAWINAHHVDQGNGIITISLNQPNSDVEEFYLDSRVANIVNAATSAYDFEIPVSEPGEGSLYMAYAVVDTKDKDKDNTYIVCGEIDYSGEGSVHTGKYYNEGFDEDPTDPTMAGCVQEIRELIAELVMHGGDYSMEDPFEKQRVTLNTLKQKYGD